MTDRVQALAGIRIIDFSHVFQGPVGIQLLADFGADVIKIERPGAGDWSRSWGPYVEGVSLPYAGLNRNKRSVTINMKGAQGKQIVRELIQSADVLVHNFRPGVMEKLGFGYEDVHALNPRLVYARSSGWGDVGPYVERGRGGHDMLARASTGWFGTHGDNDLPEPGGISADYPAGMLLTIAILVALRARELTGEGQLVSTDLFSTALHCHVWGGATPLNADRLDLSVGTADTEAAIQESWRTKAGYLEVSPVFSDNFLRDFCQALGMEDLSQDPRFDTPPKQVANSQTLCGLLQARLMAKTAEEWVAELEPKGILCGVIMSYAEAIQDPQAVANGMVIEVEHPKAGTLRVLGNPIRMSETGYSVRVMPADLGQHNAEVLSELGYSTAQIAQFEQDGVIG